MEMERGGRSRRFGGRRGGGGESGAGGEGRLVAVTINGQTAEVADGTSLFDCAAGMGIQVPTSCRKQGKCKECIVEVTEGLAELSEVTEQERHLKGNFRLSCQARVRDAEDLRKDAPASGRWQAKACPTTEGPAAALVGHALACPAGGRCHTMRRANMRIERHALGLPLRRWAALDPAVSRAGRQSLVAREGV